MREKKREKGAAGLIIIVAILVIAFFGIRYMVNEGPRTAPVKTETENIYDVKAEEKKYQDAMTELETIKSRIESHLDIYRTASLRNKSIIDRRKIKEAGKSVYESSQELQQICYKALRNNTFIKPATNKYNNIKQYQDFADRKMKEFKKFID